MASVSTVRAPGRAGEALAAPEQAKEAGNL